MNLPKIGYLIIAINWTPLKQVKQFTNVGGVIDEKGSLDKDVNRQIGLACKRAANAAEDMAKQ